MSQILKVSHIPNRLNGRVELPASKSLSNRALIIRGLCQCNFSIRNLSNADDTQLLLRLFSTSEPELYVRNAGTVMRFLTAYFAIQDGEVILRGSERMNQRPIGPLVDALLSMGADITYRGTPGFPPLLIRGKKLKGGRVTVAADISSQFISALLLIGPNLEDGITLELEGEIVSTPYIAATLATMSYFGIRPVWHDRIIHVPPQTYNSRDYYVENDWSAASYFFGLAALLPGSEIRLPELFRQSLQGDSLILKIAEDFGVTATWEREECIIRSKHQRPDFVQLDMLDYPDLVPTVSSMCCAAGVPFRFTGTHTLKHKETDRAKLLKEEISRLGYKLEVDENSLWWEGEMNAIPEGDLVLHTCEDHRMAMSWALLAVKHPGLRIENPGCVEKSFPDYWQALEELGWKFSMEEANNV